MITSWAKNSSNCAAKRNSTQNAVCRCVRFLICLFRTATCGSFTIVLAVISPSWAGDLQLPWSDPKAALVIDPYFANELNWDKLQTDPRVVAIIHKATIGVSRIDPAYLFRKQEAKRRGYLWGSYHWGTSENPEQQADFYIDSVKPASDELIALDLENVASREFMSARQALRFIKRVKERTGRYPLVYTNDFGARLISAKFVGAEFAHTPLWYARYRSTIADFPTGVWKRYTLWQFSSEISPQITLPGIKSDMDVSVAYGTRDDFRKAWPLS